MPKMHKAAWTMELETLIKKKLNVGIRDIVYMQRVDNSWFILDHRTSFSDSKYVVIL